MPNGDSASSEANRRGHPRPGEIFLSFEAPKVNGRGRQRRVVEELAHGLNALASVPAELRRGVSKDVDARLLKPCRREVQSRS